MRFVVLLASVALAAVGAAGILRPFGRLGGVRLERLADPLEDERLGLLRTLRDLDDERAAGSLSVEDHAALRAETEVRAVAVLRTLEARDGAGDLASGIRELRDLPTAGASGNGALTGPGAPTGPGVASRRRSLLPALLVVAVLVAGTVPFLVRAVASRSGAQAISGDSLIAPGTTAGPSLGLFQDRVREHPADVAARLDLGDRYAALGRDGQASQQYLAALQLDPRNVQAHAGIAMVLLRAGNAAAALQAVRQGLAVARDDSESLYDEGLILLDGLHRRDEAAVAFRAYLDAAPFGSHRDRVQSLLSDLATPSPRP